MNTKTYTSLLANTSQIEANELGALQSVVDNYPYFQSARALLLKGLKTEGSFRYNDTLKVTAAHTTNRDILFHYITSEIFDQNEISRQVLQHDTVANEIVVVVENVTDSVSLELDKQMKEELQKAEDILDPALFERKIAHVEKLLNPEELQISTSEIIKEEEEEEEEATTLKENPPTPEISEAATMEQKIEVDAPLEFKKEDTHSFGEWLKLTQATPIEREKPKVDINITTPATIMELSEEKEEFEKLKKFELIEKFIQERPKIAPQKKNILQKNTTKPYVESSNSLMTETLAKVYLQQKNYKKAIQAYKILILKNPEKSGFFADQIRAVEKLKKTEES